MKGIGMWVEPAMVTLSMPRGGCPFPTGAPGGKAQTQTHAHTHTHTHPHTERQRVIHTYTHTHTHSKTKRLILSDAEPQACVTLATDSYCAVTNTHTHTL